MNGNVVAIDGPANIYTAFNIHCIIFTVAVCNNYWKQPNVQTSSTD